MDLADSYNNMAVFHHQNGIETPEQAEAFLDPSPADLHDPALLPDLEAALDRLTTARETGESLAIVGALDQNDLCTKDQQLSDLGWRCGHGGHDDRWL